ncbi:MAG: iron-containing alcohol dehydrogenase [Anaerolineales bacterium]|nr:iron-containing alcohol dehydrogenase [Anaerolineales bacterium]MCS7247234.1 iron-containing alcohol dehydrogenase [Anaerolineales bacterium]MDW8161045.1 iron-containing alcohol dehydrogenase [Anaerolineales bacterium]MDW8448135.1 iron-containing alcohol dehydrogenase [Anaerolineales bacterium]
MVTEFLVPTRIVLGEGAVQTLGETVGSYGKKAMVFGSPSERFRATLDAQLSAQDIAYLYHPVSGEPTVESVQNAAALGKNHQVEVIVGIGGGSVLDTAKAVAGLIANEGDLYDYLEVIGRGLSLSKPALPFIALPTTAGTGSEVTKNAVIGDPTQKVKVSLRSPLLCAKVAIVDPQLTYDNPPEVTARSGMDALTQLIEPFVSNQPNELVDALCRDGIRRISRALLKAYQNGKDGEARRDMAVASLFSGIALANAKLGAVHGFAGVLGGMYGAPHGAICAALLPAVIERNLMALKERGLRSQHLMRYREIAQILGLQSEEQLVEWAAKLNEQLGIPSLSQLGVRREDFDLIVEKSSRASSMKGNPVALTKEEMVAILQRAM